MSEYSYVPFSIPCIKHPQNEVTLINLGQGVSRENRLLCQACIDSDQDYQSIESVFKFLDDTKISYSQVREDFFRIKQLYQDVKFKMEKYLDNLHQLILQFETNIESRKLIRDDVLEKMLSRLKEYSNDEFADFLEILSQNIQINNSQITLSKPFFPQQDIEQRKKIERKLRDLVEQFSFFELKCEMPIPEGISVIEFNKTGELLAIANQTTSQDSYFQIFKYQKELSLIQKLGGHTKQIKCINFSQNDSLITGSFDSRVIIWEKISHLEWAQQQVLEDHSLTVNSVKYSPSDQFIATGSLELIIWERKEKLWVVNYKNTLKKSVLCLCFSESGNLLVSGDLEKKILVSTYEQNQWKTLISVSTTTQPRVLSFFNQSDFISITNNQILLWIYSEINQNYQSRIIQNNQQIQSSSQAKDYVALSLKNTTQILQISNKTQYQTIDQFSQVVQFSKNGTLLALGSEKGLLLYYRDFIR